VVSENTPPASEAANRLIGAWRYVGNTVDGKPSTTRGTNPTGIIIYDASGHMAVQVAPDHDATATDHTAYFGTYSIDERAATVTHHKHGAVPPDDGSAVVRGYAFVGNRLILRPVEAPNYQVIWERIP
jgi:hypothetical protein